MMYLLAIVLPPLAVLLVGRPLQAVLNLILTLFFWLPGAIHAILLVHEKKADKRMKKQAKMIAKHRRNQ
ncbi:MAG TPA: YqaE/Pmp3 family membrane protein [Pseudogracilibacillus sp.]|nr:YqaE/Pmp3 family membrane protein [Pseudogracilibacillus sp.]